MHARFAIRAALAAVVLTVLWLADASAWAQEAQAVETRAGAHKGYGRIVFDWPNRPPHRARLEDGKLIVAFDKAFSSDFAGVRKHLYRYVKDILPAADGRSVAMSLLRPVTLRVREIDGVLAIDLVDAPEKPVTGKSIAGKPQATANQQPPAPEPKAVDKPSANAARVTVRVAEHGSYSRFAFDWPGNVEYRVSRRGDKVNIRFSRPATFAVKGIDSGNPRHLEAYEMRSDGDAAVIELSAIAHARYRHFRSGASVVVDLLDPPPGKRRQAKKEEDGEEAPEPPKQAAEVKGAAEKEEKPDAEGDTRPVNLLPQDVAREIGDDAVVDEQKVAQATAEPSNRSARAAFARRREPPKQRIELARDEELKAEARIYADDTVLRFEFAGEVPAAGFLRAGRLWLVFDRPASLQLDRLNPESGILSGYQISSRESTILRLELLDGLYPEMRREGAVWWIRLARGEGRPAVALSAAVQDDDGGGRIFVPADDLGRRTNIYDPEVGDEVVVVPLLGSGAGVVGERRFVDFQLLETAQGVVVRPNIDGLLVKALRNGVEVEAAGGLALSSAESRARAGGDPTAVRYRAALKAPLLLLKDWRAADDEFMERRKELQQRLARTPKAGRNQVRMELAKLYLAHDLTAEALAVLTMIEDDDPGIIEEPLFRAMRGVTNLMLNRVDVAQEDLLYARLKLHPDIALWRGALYKAQGKYEAATREFALGVGSLPLQSEHSQQKLLLDWAVAAAHGGADGEFLAAADQLGQLAQSPKVASTLAYLRGSKQEALGNREAAVDHFVRAAGYNYRPTHAMARLHLTDLERELGRIDGDEALERYDRLRFAWRGDQFEFDVIRRMIDLHLANRNYPAALNAMRTAVTNFPDNEFTRSVSQQMKQTFARLFLDGEADDLHPISALALYYEYQELTPLGSKGDRMIQRLADRLADIDLLNRAGELLSHQVRYRLKGEPKAKVGARLAVIYLLDARPNKALEALSQSETKKPLSPDLAMERRYLRARALAEMSRVDDALALLEDDDSGAADLLRADIYWRNQRWADAARMSETMLGERWRDGAELDSMEQTQVIQLAVSLYMAGDEAGLARVQRRYGSRIAEGPMSDTFRVLTNQIDPASTEFRKLATRIASVADLESFMTSYRDRLKKGGISALN